MINNIDINTITFSQKERILCFKDIKKRIVKSLHVFDKAQNDENYNYKEYINSLIIYIFSSNELCGGNSLIQIMVHLKSILLNDFSKKDFRKVILECKNILDYMIDGDGNG